MANRRVSDSQQPTRSALPAGALADVKPAKAASVASAKKLNKHTPTDPLPAAAIAPVDAALGAAPATKARKRRTAAGKTQGMIAASPAPQVSEDERRGMIALSAYLRGERRGFAPGGEAEDWLAAEKEIEALLSNSQGAAQ